MIARVVRIVAACWRSIGDAPAWMALPWLARLSGFAVCVHEALGDPDPAVLAVGAFVMMFGQVLHPALERAYRKPEPDRPPTVVGSREFYEQRALALLRDPHAEFDGLDYELAEDWIAKGGRIGPAGEHLDPEPATPMRRRPAKPYGLHQHVRAGRDGNLYRTGPNTLSTRPRGSSYLAYAYQCWKRERGL